MSYFTKKNILSILIIILLVINLVALAAFIFRPGFIFHRNEHEHRYQRCPADFFREELGLSSNQFAQFDKLRKQHMDTINILADRMKQLRSNLTTEMMKVAPDSTQLFKAADELGQIYASIKKLNLLHYWHIKSMCNDKQKQLLDSIYKEMFCCKDGMAGGCGAERRGSGCMRRLHGSSAKGNAEFSQY